MILNKYKAVIRWNVSQKLQVKSDKMRLLLLLLLLLLMLLMLMLLSLLSSSLLSSLQSRYGQGHQTESDEEEARVVITSKRKMIIPFCATLIEIKQVKKRSLILSKAQARAFLLPRRWIWSKKGKSRVETCKKFGLAPNTLQTFLRDENV